MKERLRKEVYKQKEILIIDYSDSKEAGMIETITAAKELILKDNKKVLILSIFNHKNYVSPRFMRHVEKELRDAQHLISKNAITGISDIQRWLVKGVNLWYKDQLHPFDSVDKALDFLVS
jgi:pyrroline-5-carboxylate reductase